MLENLSENQKNALIKFKSKILFFKKECDAINQKISFYKDVLLSMINNLSHCNNLRIFQDTDSNYLSILEELNEVKVLFSELPDIVIIKYFKTDYKNIMFKMTKIKKLLLKFMNHIAPDINFILPMVFYDDFNKDLNILFDKNEIDKLIFISRFIKPICLWDSDEHKKEVPIKIINGDINKKSTMVTKEIIETILGIKKPENDDNNSIIVSGNDPSFPSFLKNISEMIDIGNKKQNTKRNNHYTRIECITSLENEKIKITKNPRSISLVEDKYGTCVFIKYEKKYIVIQGLFKDDLLNFSSSIKYIRKLLSTHQEAFDDQLLYIPKNFKDSFFKTTSLRDLVVLSSTELCDEVKKKYNDFKVLQGKPLLTLINEFSLSSKFRKIDMLTLLLMSNEDDQKLAYVLFDLFRSKDKKELSIEIYNSLHYSLRELLDISKIKIEKEETDLTKFTESDLPYERRINMLKTNDDVKAKAMEKLKSMKSSFQGDSKAQHWLDGLLKIPFNNFKENAIISFKENFIKKINTEDKIVKLFSDNDIDNYIDELKEKNPDNQLISEWNAYKKDKREYLINVRKILDEAVFGHDDAKLQLERIIAQWINGEAKGAVLGLRGPPGTGKTSLAKNGLSRCLMDKDGESRPFAFLPIGGSVNGSTLVGHNFTYVGSTWGRIADILMDSKCMNPIIFIDELDKVSHTEHGREIISILTHLTDATQNDEFEDKYFAGIKLDLSKALIVFSFNDLEMIDPILRDRITIIETHPLNINEKLTIIKDYMLPEICKEVGFNKNEIIIKDELIRLLIDTYTNEAGVRKIKEKIVELIRDINLNRFHNNNFNLPYEIDEIYTKKLFENIPKMRFKKINKEPSVGMVNGLYATSSGLGGITQIEAIKFPSDKMMELNLTGKAGDVMKESVQYALKNAYRLLLTEEQDKIIEDAHNKKTFGIHIHCPDGATPKDGPSAGLAFTLAIYSLLSGKKVRNDVCLTGEVNLNLDAMIIGGLESKLNGGKKAGCTLALIPRENMEDLEIMRRKKISPEDDTFKVLPVDTIHDVLKYAIIN